jgi:hypothetical protein
MTLKSIDVPRNCEDRQTVPSWQQARDAMEEKNRFVEFFSENIRLRAGPTVRPLDTRYGPSDPILDSSGNGNTLTVETGTKRTSTLDPTVGGLLFDGATVLFVAGTPAVLRIAGALTLVMQFVWWDLPAGGGALRTIVSHGQLPGAAPATNYQYRWGMDNLSQGQFFNQHGSVVNDGGTTLSTAARYQPSLVAITRSAGGVLRHGLNGLFAGGSFGTTALPDGGTTTHFRVGGDANSNFFIGVICSIGVYSKVLTDAQFLDLYNSTMGSTYGYHQLATIPDDMQPIYYAQDDLELMGAALVPDATSASLAKTTHSFFLYKFDSSGSQGTPTLLASINGNAASAQSWTAFRAQSMRLAGAHVRVKAGETVAVSGKSSDWNGDLQLRFRRLS